MSSKHEAPGAWRFTLGLTAWFLVIFVLTATGLGFVTAHLVKGAMEEDWNTTRQEVTGTVTREGGVESRTVVVHEHETTAVPPPEMQDAVYRYFLRVLPMLLLPVIAIAVLGGLWVTWRATRPIRSVTETAQQILETGEIQRRVPIRPGDGPMGAMAELFNRLLERNQGLLLGMRESLDSVAHDLKTPMTRLRATAERALEQDAGTAAYREALEDTLVESESVLSMLDTLMDVAEAEAGAMHLDGGDVSIQALVASVVDLYELVVEEKGITLRHEVQPPDLTVRGDATRLRRVLANLVDNAAKYSDAGSTVEIDARALEDTVEIRVLDRGRGLAPEDVPLIWDRLYRGDRSRSEEGLGLGLSYVRAVVAAHGGRVDARPREGGGSVFTVRLPSAG